VSEKKAEEFNREMDTDRDLPLLVEEHPPDHASTRHEAKPENESAVKKDGLVLKQSRHRLGK
jgi:hypothetical protein